MVVYSDELCHWAKGSVGKNHKYIEREWKNGRWRYYYPEAKIPSLGLNARKKLKDYEKDAASYKAKAEEIAKKYNVSVSDIVSSREVKVGKAYTDEFIKTGPTLADIPLFGTMYYGRVVAEKDANARREMVREESKKRY